MILFIALAAGAVTASCVPPKKPFETRGEVVGSFMAALAKHDQATLGSYIKPGAKAVTGGDTFDLAEMLSAMNPNAKLVVTGTKFNQDQTIVVTYTIDDGDPTSVSFAQDGGCIVSMTQV